MPIKTLDERVRVLWNENNNGAPARDGGGNKRTVLPCGGHAVRASCTAPISVARLVATLVAQLWHPVGTPGYMKSLYSHAVLYDATGGVPPFGPHFTAGPSRLFHMPP